MDTCPFHGPNRPHGAWAILYPSGLRAFLTLHRALLTMDHSNPKYLTSLLKVSLMTALRVEADIREEFLLEVCNFPSLSLYIYSRLTA